MLAKPGNGCHDASSAIPDEEEEEEEEVVSFEQIKSQKAAEAPPGCWVVPVQEERRDLTVQAQLLGALQTQHSQATGTAHRKCRRDEAKMRCKAKE